MRKSFINNNRIFSFEMNALITIGIFSIFLTILIIPIFFVHNVFGQTSPNIVSTRGFFDLDSGSAIHEGELPSALSILNINNCPGEIAIYVHGVWAEEKDAIEQTERVFLSLKKSGYEIPLIGFSWDSNTAFSLDNIPLSMNGWTIAKYIANSNGPLLGKFIKQFNYNCPNDTLRIIAHSLGSRVTLSAIQWLFENSIIDNSKKISSVHLLGAAIDDEQLSVIESQCNENNNPPLSCSGNAIEHIVGKFYNLYNPEDNMLAYEEFIYEIPTFFGPFSYTITYPSPYLITERDKPLGAYGIQNGIGEPENYHEYNVLPNIRYQQDSDQINGCDLRINLKHFGYPFGNLYWCTISKEGDNHFGYLGFRDINSELKHVGAIKLVVINWLSE